MGKRLVDDTIIVTDLGEDRMYFSITPELRLRSADPYNVVLERYREIESKNNKRMDWAFEGYYQSGAHLLAAAAAYTRYFKLYGRKFTRTHAQEHAVSSYFNVFQHINTSCVDASVVSKFVKEAKEYERVKPKNWVNKGLEKAHKNAKARKDAKEKNA